MSTAGGGWGTHGQRRVEGERISHRCKGGKEEVETEGEGRRTRAAEGWRQAQARLQTRRQNTDAETAHVSRRRVASTLSRRSHPLPIAAASALRTPIWSPRVVRPLTSLLVDAYAWGWDPLQLPTLQLRGRERGVRGYASCEQRRIVLDRRSSVGRAVKPKGSRGRGAPVIRISRTAPVHQRNVCSTAHSAQ